MNGGPQIVLNASERPAETDASGTNPPMRRKPSTLMQTALLVLAVIYTLVVARSLILPIVLALMLSLVFAPLTRRLQGLHLSRSIAAALLVVGLVCAVGYGVSILTEPASQWMDKAPHILREIERDLHPIKETVEEVNRTAEEVDRIASVGNATTVQVKGLTFRDVLYSNARGLLTGTVITIFMLYFFLAWGRTMLQHIGEILSGHRSQRRFLDLAHVLELELSKYLLTITLINVALGAIVAGLLQLVGMPNPLLWGTIATLFNFVPYIGSLATAVLLAGAALVSFDGILYPVLISGGFILLTTLEGQVITPEILGRRLALNPLMVFLSIIVWFWLWGPAGALMAVPILLCIRIIGDHVDSVKPVAELVGR